MICFQSENEVESWFRDELSGNGSVLINNNAPLPIESFTGSVENVMVSLYPSEVPCWPFCSAELKTCQLTITHEVELESDKR